MTCLQPGIWVCFAARLDTIWEFWPCASVTGSVPNRESLRQSRYQYCLPCQPLPFLESRNTEISCRFLLRNRSEISSGSTNPIQTVGMNQSWPEQINRSIQIDLDQSFATDNRRELFDRLQRIAERALRLVSFFPPTSLGINSFRVPAHSEGSQY